MTLHFNDNRERLNIKFDYCKYNSEDYSGTDWIRITPEEMETLQNILDHYTRGSYTPDDDLRE